MTFDVYYPQEVKEGVWVPGTKPVARPLSEIFIITQLGAIAEYINEYRAGNAESKKKLPAVTWSGTSTTTRANVNMTPTQLVLVDVDHVEDVEKAKTAILQYLKDNEDMYDRSLLWHITPSGKGIRGVFWAFEDLQSIKDNQERVRDLLNLPSFGDFDAGVHDFARLSFLPMKDEIFFVNEKYIENGYPYANGVPLVNVSYGEDASQKPSKSDVPDFTDEEKERFEALDFRGTPLKVIVDKYIEGGQPSSGEIHNYYNEMVKYFRCICDNNKRALLYLLPMFGHTKDECWSQIKSICKVNTLSTIPKPFWFFLKDNGFLKKRNGENLKDDEEDIEEKKMSLPYLPPVFAQLVKSAPADFKYPVVVSLLPILGTLTSYAQALYPYDDRMHTTSFFTVIYAPPGTGKGFVGRFMDMLFRDLKLRDLVNSERENIYLRAINRKGSNDKAPDLPHTSLRIIPAKNSEAEFLQKQKDNHGYHMFTYAAEMDSWAKGVRAAGGNKDDMIRIAWDNEEYGQQFKSANTFKGTVKLYWNVLITGTIQQLTSYFKNVENGLVTRCSFATIENQEYAPPPKWKKLSAKDMAVINKFLKRCDENTYEEPCNIVPDNLYMISDADFDKEVNWKFDFKERKTMDCSWIMPSINAFHERQMREAALSQDAARDVFRRRVGVRGFRLALLCMCLFDRPSKRDLERCIPFVEWFMEQDMKSIMQLWSEDYNRLETKNSVKVQPNLFVQLGDTFTKNDLYSVCIKQGIKTALRRIIFDWKRLGYIEETDNKTYKKKV
ncbi:MAG: DUF3987 domain-containing protein [Prevotellamassilia sp.]|nr:DUF3987 domain-containing protein [Prevotellamassilia sp.]